MRRLMVSLLLAVAVLPSAGCVFALDVRGLPHHRQVVEVDGEFYVVDLKTHRVRKMDAIWDIQEETTTPTDEVIVED